MPRPGGNQASRGSSLGPPRSLTAEKCRRSRVAIASAFMRSATAITVASTNPSANGPA